MINKTKKKDDNSSNFVCTVCGNEKKEGDFYKSNSVIFKHTGKICVCKDCLIDLYGNYIEKYNNTSKAVYKICEKLDVYYEDKLFEAAEQQAKAKGSVLIQIYFQKVNSMKQYKGFTFEDTIVSIKEENFQTDFTNEDEESENRTISPELTIKWGKTYTVLQIIKLEKFFTEMTNSYKVETASHKDYLFKISKVSLKMDEALDSGDIAEFEKLSRVYDTLMKSAKFTAMQRSAVDDVGGFATFSEFILNLEKEGFIQPHPLTEDFDIVEKTINDINNYTKKLILGDSSISTLAQDTLLKMQQKEEENDFDNSEDDLIDGED